MMTDAEMPPLADLGLSELSPSTIEEKLPKIISIILENNCDPSFLQLLTVVFGQLASQFEIDILDHKLLQHVLPPSERAFENSIEEISKLLEEYEDMDEEVAISISKSLQVCLNILSGYGELLDLLSTKSVQADHVKSLNRTLPPILIGAFSHCRDSQNVYGAYFEESTTILTTFFRKSYEIQMKYYKILDENILFSSPFEEDLDCLVQVLEAIIKITGIVVSLDVKTCVDQWKFYGKLYSKYISELRQAIDVSQSLSMLTSNVQQIMTGLTACDQDTSEKAQLKFLKIGNFLLKMIVRLCELSECRFHEGWKPLAELLLLLYSCTKTYEMNDHLKEEVRRFISVGATPLLVVLVKEDDFLKIFNDLKNNYEDLTSASKIGLVFLSLSIMKMVIERKASACWNSVPFIELVFDLYDSCGLMVDMNSHFEGNDAYTSLISICAAFVVATVEDSSFSTIENYLIAKLFRGELHTSILVCDFLCLIGRLTSDHYCLHLATYFCETLKAWPNLSFDRYEYKIIGNMVLRLWRLLSPKSRELLRSKYVSEGSHHIQYWFGESDSYCWIVSEKYESFCSQPTLSSFISLIASSPSEATTEGTQSHRTPQSKTIGCVKNTVSFFNLKKSLGNEYLWFPKLLLHSLKLFSNMIRSTPTEMINEVFEELTESFNHTGDSQKLLALLFLSKLPRNLPSIETNSPLAFRLAGMLLKLFEADDKVLTFSALILWKTMDKRLALKEVVSLDPSLNEKYLNVNAQFQSMSANDRGTSYHAVICSLPEPTHSCRRRSVDAVVSDFGVPPSKKLKMESTVVDHAENSELARCLERLRNETAFLKRICPQLGLPHKNKILLNIVIDELKSVVDSEKFNTSA